METYEIILVSIVFVTMIIYFSVMAWPAWKWLYDYLFKKEEKKEGENMEDILKEQIKNRKLYFEHEMTKFCAEHHIGFSFESCTQPGLMYKYTFAKVIPRTGFMTEPRIRDREFTVNFKDHDTDAQLRSIQGSLRLYFELDRECYYPDGCISYYPASRLSKEEMNALCGRCILEKFDDTFPERILEYCKNDVEFTTELYRRFSPKTKFPAIKNVIFQNPATIVFWSDGTKTVVKAKDEAFDEEKGLAMAISKKVLGNKYAWKDEFRKWLPEIPGGPVEDSKEEAKDEEKTLADEIEYYLHNQICLPRCFVPSKLPDVYAEVIQHFLLDKDPNLQMEVRDIDYSCPDTPLRTFRIGDYRYYYKWVDIDVWPSDLTNFYNKAADKICQVKDYFGLV